MISLLHIADILVLFHSIRVYGRRWTVCFFLVAFSAGFTSEYVGVHYGWIFSKFHYPSNRLNLFGTLPVLTPIGWWLVLYCAYNVTNLILGDMRITAENRFRYVTGALMPAALDALVAMNLDMLLDPIMVCPERRRWVWDTVGSYFGIPLQNFFGWFLVAFMASLLVRSREVGTVRILLLGDRLLHYFPLGVYASIFFFLATLSYVGGYLEYVLIGMACMMPFILLGLLRGLVAFQVRRG